ncbi:hypothetical protein L218DRAFT_999296 [Marasmius fiardii PR-910]|nr:hypothetical protein L218DRAFT_999296 [Marasmius fiardii PR-910]
MPPSRYPREANHNTTFDRIRGNQTNNHYGDINHISDSYNTTTTNNHGSDDPIVDNSDNNNLQNDWSEMSKSHERRITASRRQPLGYPLFKTSASHPIRLGRDGDLAGWQQSYPPPLPPQNLHPFQPQSIAHLHPYPPNFHDQALPEGYLHDPLPTPDISGLMRRNQTTTYNHVQGSQINNYTYQNQFIEQNEKEHTTYDEV